MNRADHALNPLDHDIHARRIRAVATREMWAALRQRLFAPRANGRS